MCGIALVLDEGTAETPALSALARIHGALAHRGPDGEGCLVVDGDLAPRRFPSVGAALAEAPAAPRVAVGFRRLSIQDLTEEAAQPLASADGRHWIVHNGEIYNHAELRDALRARGHAFHTSSDTEVALAAYREWGSACFGRFNGMWAILILDLARGRLVGSRDRLGIKPLFYGAEPGRLSFASEPQALALTRPGGPRVESVRFFEFLRGIPPQTATRSFFRDIRPVPAGALFEIDLRGGARAPDFRVFWDLADYHSREAAAPRYEDALEQFRTLFQSAVELQLAAAVPVGCLLSGGLDSSLVATAAAHRTTAVRGGRRLQAYSLVYDDPEMSERPYIAAVATAARLDSRVHILRPSEVWGSVDAVVQAQGQPLLGQDVIAQYHAYRLARANGAIVVLEGQGADELLAGLPSYEAAFMRELLVTLRLHDLFVEVRCRARRYDVSMLGIVKRYVGFGLRSRFRFARRVRRYTWLRGAPASRPGGAPEPDVGKPRSPDPSLLNQYLYRLTRHTNLPTVLLYQDRSSMANGVESRVPFLDHRLVELCFRLPPEYKVRYGTRKRLILDVARDMLPAVVTGRTDKKTFVSKLHWMPLRREHGAELRDMARSRTVLDCPYLDGRKVAPFVEQYLQGRHDDGSAVWRLYTAWRWLELFRLS